MGELSRLDLKSMIDGLRNRKFSSVELVKDHIALIENDKTNSFISTNFDLALESARQSDARLESGHDVGLLEGIPIAVKDMFCTKGIATTAGSRMLENYIPPYDACMVEKIKNAGSVIVGKANMDEFAMGSANLHSYFGRVINPWRNIKSNTEVVPGGSSGGSAAANASYLSPIALGSDTGGSVRQPASFCGLVGVKPTYGRCSRWGMIAFACSLDHPGVFTRSVWDAAYSLNIMAGYDKRDPSSANIPVPDFTQDIPKGVKGMTVGIPKEYVGDGVSADVKREFEKTVELLRSAGVQIKEVSIPSTKEALTAYYVIAPAEASSNLARYDGIRYGYRPAQDPAALEDLYYQVRSEGFGAEVKRRIMLGTCVLHHEAAGAYYNKAVRVRNLLCEEFKKAMDGVDLLISPTTPTTAFGFDAGQEHLVEYMNDVLTVSINLVGVPAMSVPIGVSDEGLPVGMQIIGGMFREQDLFRLAGGIEELVDFDKHRKNFLLGDR